jgi:hypothetical protein
MKYKSEMKCGGQVKEEIRTWGWKEKLPKDVSK